MSHTPFKDMKKGPVRDIVERELRALANDLEGYLDMGVRAIYRMDASEYPGDWEKLSLGDIRLIILGVMIERGIEPRENYVS